jgi:hypothetical protein
MYALSKAALPPETRRAFRSEMIAFLRHCKTCQVPATIMIAKQYLAAREAQGAMVGRPALRWFFQMARRPAADTSGGRASDGPPMTASPEAQSSRVPRPPPAATDRGRRVGARPHRSHPHGRPPLRTEETHRGWARRFARFLAPRSPCAAEAADVGGFLTRMAAQADPKVAGA